MADLVGTPEDPFSPIVAQITVRTTFRIHPDVGARYLSYDNDTYFKF